MASRNVNAGISNERSQDVRVDWRAAHCPQGICCYSYIGFSLFYSDVGHTRRDHQRSAASLEHQVLPCIRADRRQRRCTPARTRGKPNFEKQPHLMSGLLQTLSPPLPILMEVRRGVLRVMTGKQYPERKTTQDSLGHQELPTIITNSP